MTARLADVFKVRPGEGRTAALLAALMFATSAGGSVGGNATEALFYARFGVQFLPYMYVGLGLITIVMTFGVTAVLGRVPRERLYVTLPVALAGVLVLERIVLTFEIALVYPVIWLAMNVMGSLQGILTWGLASAACDTRQAKRLFSLFGAGGILGAVAGGLLTQPLVGVLHVENLLLVWALALVVAFLVGRALVGGRAATRPPRRRTRIIDELTQGASVARRSPLIGWMALATLPLAVLFFSLAFPFSKAATAEFPNADALAGFLGLFQGASTGAAFLASLFVANRLYARFGIMTTLLAFSLIYLVGFAALTAYAAFPMLVAFRFVQVTWLSGVAGSAYQALFNVVPPERRDQTRAFLDGVPGQAGTILAGAILIVGESALAPRELYLIGLAAALVTTFLVWRASRAYGAALVAALRAGIPQIFFAEEEPFGGFRQDRAAVAAAIAGLSNADPIVRRVAAEVLAHLRVPEATAALVAALRDGDATVRAAALRAITAASVAPEIAPLLADADPDVRLAAIGALERLKGAELAPLRPLLGDPAVAVRAAAAVALVRRDRDARALDALRALASHADPEARAGGLAALAELGDRDAFDLVASALDDPNATVRRAAASALPRVDPDRAVPPLAEALADPDGGVREAAAGSLGRIGTSALPPVLSALGRPGAQAGALLALEALPLDSVEAPLRAYAGEQVRLAVRFDELARGLAPEGDGARRMLEASLRTVAETHATSALRAVGALGDRAAIALVIESLRSRDPAQRANAAEALEALGEREVIQPLLRLWEPAAATPGGAGGGLLPLLGVDDPWLRACAAYVAGRSSEAAPRAALSRLAAADPDSFVRETALAAVDGGKAMETLATLSLMERILFLRRVPLFADFAPSDLKQIAALVEERLYPDGEVICRQGELGSELYVIASGEVRVLSGEDGQQTEVARRRAGEYVGEMAILSREPRNATLVATGDVRALVLEQKQFEGILRERPETSLAVVRVLCARLRELMR